MQLPAIWVSRPQPHAGHFAAALSLRGIPAIIAPVMEMIALPLANLPLMPDAIAITSGHSVHALHSLPESWRSIPVYTVGVRTAAAINAAGYRALHAPMEGAAAMLARLRESLPQASHVLYLHGDVTHINLPEKLEADGYHCQSLEVYRALAIEKPAAALVQALEQQRVVALTCFSARSVTLAYNQLLQAGLQNNIAQLQALCLSAAIAEAANACGFAHTRTAAHAHDDAMLALAENAIRAMA